MNEEKRMKESTERCKNMHHEPTVYGFEGESLKAAHEALGKALASGSDARLIVRLGRKADGMPEAWLDVKVGTERVGAYNVSYTCPPKPPEYCEE